MKAKLKTSYKINYNASPLSAQLIVPIQNECLIYIANDRNNDVILRP